jgi:hypothetical protein
MGQSTGCYLKHIKEVYTLYYGTEISLVTNNVTNQFLHFHFRIKIFVAILTKIKKLKSFKIFQILELADFGSCYNEVLLAEFI